MASQDLVTENEVYHPNAVVNGHVERARAFLDQTGQEAWLSWANGHDLMPNTRAAKERREQIARQQAEAERVIKEEREKAKQAKRELTREKEKRAMAEKGRQAALAKRAGEASGALAGSSRRAGPATPSTSRLIDEDVEMWSEKGAEVRKGKGKAKERAKGKGKGKAKAKEGAIPANAVKVSPRSLPFILANPDVLFLARRRQAVLAVQVDGVVSGVLDGAPRW